MGSGGCPDPPRATGSTQNLAFLVYHHDGDKKFGWRCQKKDFWPKNCIFGPKISFFLRYAHITQFFGLRRNRLNGIITSSCPGLTLDTFGFPEGARSAGLFLAPMAQNGPFWVKNAIFWPQWPPWHPNCNWTRTNKVAFLVISRDGNKKMGCCSKKYGFWPKKLLFWPKNQFFSTLRPNNPIRLRRTQLNGIISSPCPEVTLDTLGFPVGAHSAAQRAVF